MEKNIIYDQKKGQEMKLLMLFTILISLNANAGGFSCYPYTGVFDEWDGEVEIDYTIQYNFTRSRYPKQWVILTREDEMKNYCNNGIFDYAGYPEEDLGIVYPVHCKEGKFLFKSFHMFGDNLYLLDITDLNLPGKTSNTLYCP